MSVPAGRSRLDGPKWECGMGSEVRGGVVTGIELIEAGYRGVNGVSIDGSCRRIDGIDGIDGL